MERDLSDDPNSDPEGELRRRISSQVAGDVPEPVASPVYDDPAPIPPPPPASPDTSGQDITDPTVRSVQPDAPAPPPPAPPDSASIGAGTPWAAGASAPTGAPAGYHWDANMANFMPDAAAPAPKDPGAGGRPSGGSLTDPNFAAQYVAWAGTQPGVNPSVKNDPGYWIGRFTSGAFGNDQNYALQRMMQAEGAPEGARAAVTAPRVTAPGATSGGGQTIAAPTPTNFTSLFGQSGTGPQGVWDSPFVQQVRAMLMQRLGQASQPVDPNDPSITAPLTAARDEATRGSDKERTELAEHLYASGGLNTDAIGQKIQQSGEKNALGLSSLRATLITRELQSKRDELKSLLQMALQSGDAESAQAIQMQLAELSATVQREGLGVDLAKYQGYLNALGSEQVMN